MRIKRVERRVMERKDIIMKKIIIITIRKVKKVTTVIRMSMERKVAIKSTKNGDTKKDTDTINKDRPQQYTQLYLEYMLCSGIFVPVIIAIILNGLD